MAEVVINGFVKLIIWITGKIVVAFRIFLFSSQFDNLSACFLRETFSNDCLCLGIIWLNIRFALCVLFRIQCSEILITLRQVRPCEGYGKCVRTIAFEPVSHGCLNRHNLKKLCDDNKFIITLNHYDFSRDNRIY